MKKLRQITDNMRSTIYLSKLESGMMSTPFFNRLNDVYQSSTVYMVYPSNRTKRYEHSLGTMELASQMFCASIQNANPDDKKAFFEKIEETFKIIIAKTAERNKLAKVFYVDRGVANKLNELLPASVCGDIQYAYNSISTAMTAGVVGDIALTHNAICFNDISLVAGLLSQEKVCVYSYLYQCCLEAIRISALFHDVGHPPYSHIVEEVLVELYKSLQADRTGYDTKKVDEFIDSLKPLLENQTLPQLLLDDEEAHIDNALHEQVGIKILESTFYGMILELLGEVDKEHDNLEELKFAKSLYYITIIEFTFSILLEKTPEMKAIHHIISGTIDTDRLDYIMRDSINSGVNWGEIPYKRIVESAKLIYADGKFCVAFPEKTSEDLDDLLVIRYKIFNRINYHHRVVKTAAVLQNVIRLLSLDYLEQTNDSFAICTEIKDLWLSLKDVVGSDATEKKIGRWNDSWLISVFNNALSTLSDSGERAKLQNRGINKDIKKERNSNFEHIQNMLEEVLLNKKHYHSMIKRRNDVDALMEDVVNSINMTASLEKIKVKEYRKLTNKNTDKVALDEAGEALRRLQKIEQNIEESDFEMLEKILSLHKHYDEVIAEVLNGAKERKEIRDFIIKRNFGRSKYGVDILLPDDNNDDNAIYLYNGNGHYSYNVRITLTKQLMALRLAYPWIFVYIKPNKGEDFQNVISKLKSAIAEELGDKIKKQMEELFNVTL